MQNKPWKAKIKKVCLFIGKIIAKAISMGLGVCVGLLLFRITAPMVLEKYNEIVNQEPTSATETTEESKYGVTADMSGYTFLDSSEGNGFIQETMETANTVMTSETALIYLGSTKCQWCQRAVPVLQEVAENESMAILYVDTYNDYDEEQYTKMKEILKDYLEFDEEGNAVLYTPMVIAVKDGKILGTHSGTVDSFEITDETSNFNTEQHDELYNIYDNLAKQVLETE